MAVVKNLMVRAGADFSGMSKAMSRASKDINNFKSSVSKSLKGLGALMAATGTAFSIAGATKDAITFESSIDQINRTMGKSAKSFQDWSDTNAAAFGMGKKEAAEYGAIFSNLISGFASDTAYTSKYTVALLEAAAVTSAKTGRAMGDTLNRIRSGMLGSTEAIEDLGINVNIAMIESTKAFKDFANGKSWQQLDFNTQQQIRLFAILEQAAGKYGTEIGGTVAANQLRFTAHLKNAKLYLGQAFMTIYSTVLPALTVLAQALSKVTYFIAQFTQALFGKKKDDTTKTINAQTSAVSGVGEAYEDAGKAAKKAAGYLAGFDEVNTAGSSSGGDAGSSGTTAGSISAEQIDAGGFAESTVAVSDRVREMVEKVKASFREMSGFIVQHKDIILSALAGLAAGFATVFLVTKWSAIIGGITTALTKVGAAAKAAWLAITGPLGLITIAIAAVVAAFVYFYRTNEQFKGFVDGILQKIGEVAQWLWNDVLVPFGQWAGTKLVEYWGKFKVAMVQLWNDVLVPFGAWLMNVMPIAWQKVTEAAQWLWQNVLVPLGAFLVQLWNTVIVPLAKILADVLGVAFRNVAEIAKAFWIDVLVPLGKALGEMFGPTIEAISAVLTWLWKNVFVSLGNYMSQTFVPGIASLIQVFEFLWKNVLKPLTSFMSDIFIAIVKSVFKAIGELINGAKTIFIGLMDFITGVFTGNWQKAWDGVKLIFKGVFDSLYVIVKTPLNLIIDMVNKVIDSLNSIKIDLPDWAEKVSGYKSFGLNIPKLPRLSRGGVVNGTTNMGNYIAGEAGAEMIVPLENTSFTDKIASALGTAVMTAMQLSQGNGKEIALQVDGVTFARLQNAYSAKESARIGGSLITTT